MRKISIFTSHYKFEFGGFIIGFIVGLVLPLFSFMGSESFWGRGGALSVIASYQFLFSIVPWRIFSYLH